MFIFPAHRFNPDPVTAEPVPRKVSGGVALNDVEDEIITDGGGRWQISYGEFDVDEPELSRLWTQWQGFIGRGEPFLVPILSLETAPRPTAGGGLMDPSNLYDDDDAFPTEVRFGTPYIIAQLAGDVPLRGTTMTINVIQGARIKGGEKFSIGVRGFAIERVLSRSGQQATVLVNPPSRKALPAGSPVNFEWPVVQCRAVAGQNLAVAMSLGMYGSTSISFVEDFSDAG